LEQAAAAKGVTNDEWNKFIAYVAGFYGNMANYHSFGHMKFIPEVSEETFKTILDSNPLMEQEGALYKSVIEELWPLIQPEIFNIEKPYTQLNFPSDGGVTGYFGRNITKDDLALLQEFGKSIKLDLLHTRAFKKADGSFVITVACVDQSTKTHKFKDIDFHVVYGEFSPYLKDVVDNLTQAKKYAANDNQRKMLEEYITHFQTGDIEAHRNSMRAWVKDLGPVVETNIGFTETYIDPEGIRAYFEGWVAIVDKPKSEKF
jgi:dipeptidyl-peptidase-3